MTRDEKTTFEHQRALLEDRPEITPDLAQRAETVKSFNVLVGPDELVLAMATDKGTRPLRVNPDVALNLAVNLLKVVQAQGWSKMNFQIDETKVRGN